MTVGDGNSILINIIISFPSLAPKLPTTRMKVVAVTEDDMRVSGRANGS